MAEPLNPQLIRELDTPADVIPGGAPSTPPSFHERMGHALDMPSVNFPAALEAFDADTDNRFAVQDRPLPGVFDKHNRQVSIGIREPLSNEEIKARNERRDALILNLTRMGAAKIADHFIACAADRDALLSRLESLDADLAELEPTNPSKGLGELGDYEHTEYGLKVAPLLAERGRILASLRELQTDLARGEEVREAGGWAAGLAHLMNFPALARRYVENLHGTPGVEPVAEVPAPPDAPGVELHKLEMLMIRTGRRLANVETTYTKLRERDATRRELADADADRRADEAAAAGASPEVVTRLRPRRTA